MCGGQSVDLVGERRGEPGPAHVCTAGLPKMCAQPSSSSRGGLTTSAASPRSMFSSRSSDDSQDDYDFSSEDYEDVPSPWEPPTARRQRRPNGLHIVCNSEDQSRIYQRIPPRAQQRHDPAQVAMTMHQCLEERHNSSKREDEPATPASPVSPADTVETPVTSKSHIDKWTEASETLIILDWDDTLFPTTWVWQDPRLNWNEVAPCYAEPSMPATPPAVVGNTAGRQARATQSDDVVKSASSDSAASSKKDVQETTMIELIENHVRSVVALLRLACSLGRVVIVTLAQVNWVETSMRNFMPDLAKTLEELNIEVVYARQTLPARSLRRGHEEGVELTRALKQKAMSRVIKNFYGTGKDTRERSWKNVLSIGDSAAERWALQDLIFARVQRDRHGAPKECRCKVLKLLSEPSLDRLTAEIQVLLSWLTTLVTHDGDLDIDFGEMDEAQPETPSPQISSSRSRSTRKKAKDEEAKAEHEKDSTDIAPT